MRLARSIINEISQPSLRQAISQVETGVTVIHGAPMELKKFVSWSTTIGLTDHLNPLFSMLWFHFFAGINMFFF